MELESEYDFINQLIQTFINILSSIYFSRKRLNFDEFDEKIIDETDLIQNIIPGVFSLVNYPRGIVYYHKNNSWKMDNLKTFFIIYKNCIPNLNHNLPKQLLIKRSNGSDCYAKLLNFESLFISDNKKDDFCLNVNFKADNSKYDYLDMENTCNSYYTEFVKEKTKNNGIIETDCELFKIVYLKDIFRLNDIDQLTINFDIYSNSYIEEKGKTNEIKEIQNNFNKKLIEWVNNILNPFIKRNSLNVKVEYNLIN